jgi:two-component system, response regulator PdtaR
VLLVEDEALVRMIAAEVLEDAGFDVVEAGHSAAALQQLGAGLVPDALVTDVRMPGPVDGFALSRIVAERWPQVGIVICSGHASPAAGDMPEGAVFLPKPYLPLRLVDEVFALIAPATADVR